MRIITDTHLALNRKAHTTLESRRRLKRHLRAQMLDACEAAPGAVFHAGDLFDKHSNSERDILEVAQAAVYCDFILAGNHDLVNEEGATGSLDILAELLEDCAVLKCEKLDAPHYETFECEGMEFAAIPHHATQDLFDQAVEAVIEKEASLNGVFLHCNYENKMAAQQGTSLNLTEDQARSLLVVSEYVFLGHEHQPRELLDGKLIILGNLHPTSFADISDKFYYDLTPRGLKKTKCWSAETGHLEIEFDADTLPDISGTQAQFINITGTIPMEQGASLAEFLSHCWEGSEAYMIRNSVTVQSGKGRDLGATDIGRLDKTIADDLKGTELETLWADYWGRVE